MENLGHVDHQGKVRKIDIEAVVRRLSYSDWLILYYLAQVRNCHVKFAFFCRHEIVNNITFFR